MFCRTSVINLYQRLFFFFFTNGALLRAASLRPILADTVVDLPPFISYQATDPEYQNSKGKTLGSCIIDPGGDRGRGVVSAAAGE